MSKYPLKEENVNAKSFHKMLNGKQVKLFMLQNKNGMRVAITNYGATVVSIFVPDRKGNFVDVVLGYDTLEEYVASDTYFGSTVGRYANRIAAGKFSLDKVNYILDVNNGHNHLHGGKMGFDAVVWDVEFLEEKQKIVMSYFSEEGEEHYPGNLSTKVIFQLTDENELKIRYQAKTDKKTIVNLTNHSYFNLDGPASDSILNHSIKINADSFTPINKHQIPTGEILEVKDTPMDFRGFTEIGKSINDDDEQLKFGFGYDHNWVLNPGKQPIKAAVIFGPESGRYMEVWTNQPGLQFYTSNFLDGSQVGKNKKAYQRRSAFCVETQHFPDSPNQPHFPSTVLEPDEEYDYICIYKFSSKIIK